LIRICGSAILPTATSAGVTGPNTRGFSNRITAGAAAPPPRTTPAPAPPTTPGRVATPLPPGTSSTEESWHPATNPPATAATATIITHFIMPPNIDPTPKNSNPKIAPSVGGGNQTPKNRYTSYSVRRALHAGVFVSLRLRGKEG
jgi:hypothetical protein